VVQFLVPREFERGGRREEGGRREGGGGRRMEEKGGRRRRREKGGRRKTYVLSHEYLFCDRRRWIGREKRETRRRRE
jgi:hypothetical protein